MLARQLAWVASVVGVQRERGLAPDVAVTTGEGKALFLRHDGAHVARRPSVVTTTVGDQVNVQITGRSPEEVTQHARAVRKKHPEANVDESLAGMTRTRRYVDSLFQFTLALGGTEANASLIKTALAAAHGAGMDVAACDLPLAYLRTFEGQPPVNFFFSRELIPHDLRSACSSSSALKRTRRGALRGLTSNTSGSGDQSWFSAPATRGHRSNRPMQSTRWRGRR